jgi:uncharacterized protein YndB with AHSA1/START domain
MAEHERRDAATDDGMTVWRVFDAPRERVWKEWTEPERFADWFGGAQSEIPLNSVSMDVTPGGAWRLTMLAGAREIRWKGEYREVDEPERLVFTITDEPEGDEYDLVIVVLSDLGDGRTEMRLEQRGKMGREQYERAASGWGVFFDRMAEGLAAV